MAKKLIASHPWRWPTHCTGSPATLVDGRDAPPVCVSVCVTNNRLRDWLGNLAPSKGIAEWNGGNQLSDVTVQTDDRVWRLEQLALSHFGSGVLSAIFSVLIQAWPYGRGVSRIVRKMEVMESSRRTGFRLHSQ